MSDGSDDALVEFLKQFSSIPNEFIDDLFSFYDPETAQNEPAIDIDAVAKWLQIAKFKLMETLRTSYKLGIDFTVTKMRNPRSTVSKYGANSYKQVLLTPDCFKRMCMRSKGKMAEDVRTYFISRVSYATSCGYPRGDAAHAESFARTQAASRFNKGCTKGRVHLCAASQ
jgi:hypothetical protein